MERGKEVPGDGSVSGFVMGMDVLLLRMSARPYGIGRMRANFGKCCSAAWLSFYFTDCLMSRWYVPRLGHRGTDANFLEGY